MKNKTRFAKYVLRTFIYFSVVNLFNLQDLFDLSSERDSLSKSSLSSRWLRQHGGAACAVHDGGSVAKYGADLVASWATHIHEVRVRALHEALQLVLAHLVLLPRL